MPRLWHAPDPVPRAGGAPPRLLQPQQLARPVPREELYAPPASGYAWGPVARRGAPAAGRDAFSFDDSATQAQVDRGQASSRQVAHAVPALLARLAHVYASLQPLSGASSSRSAAELKHAVAVIDESFRREELLALLTHHGLIGVALPETANKDQCAFALVHAIERGLLVLPRVAAPLPPEVLPVEAPPFLVAAGPDPGTVAAAGALQPSRGLLGLRLHEGGLGVVSVAEEGLVTPPELGGGVATVDATPLAPTRAGGGSGGGGGVLPAMVPTTEQPVAGTRNTRSSLKGGRLSFGGAAAEATGVSLAAAAVAPAAPASPAPRPALPLAAAPLSSHTVRTKKDLRENFVDAGPVNGYYIESDGVSVDLSDDGGGKRGGDGGGGKGSGSGEGSGSEDDVSRLAAAAVEALQEKQRVTRSALMEAAAPPPPPPARRPGRRPPTRRTRSDDEGAAAQGSAPTSLPAANVLSLAGRKRGRAAAPAAASESNEEEEDGTAPPPPPKRGAGAAQRSAPPRPMTAGAVLAHTPTTAESSSSAASSPVAPPPQSQRQRGRAPSRGGKATAPQRQSPTPAPLPSSLPPVTPAQLSTRTDPPGAPDGSGRRNPSRAARVVPKPPSAEPAGRKGGKARRRDATSSEDDDVPSLSSSSYSGHDSGDETYSEDDDSMGGGRRRRQKKGGGGKGGKASKGTAAAAPAPPSPAPSALSIVTCLPGTCLQRIFPTPAELAREAVKLTAHAANVQAKLAAAAAARTLIAGSGSSTGTAASSSSAPVTAPSVVMLPPVGAAGCAITDGAMYTLGPYFPGAGVLVKVSARPEASAGGEAPVIFDSAAWQGGVVVTPDALQVAGFSPAIVQAAKYALRNSRVEEGVPPPLDPHLLVMMLAIEPRLTSAFGSTGKGGDAGAQTLGPLFTLVPLSRLRRFSAAPFAAAASPPLPPPPMSPLSPLPPPPPPPPPIPVSALRLCWTLRTNITIEGNVAYLRRAVWLPGEARMSCITDDGRLLLSAVVRARMPGAATVAAPSAAAAAPAPAAAPAVATAGGAGFTARGASDSTTAPARAPTVSELYDMWAAAVKAATGRSDLPSMAAVLALKPAAGKKEVATQTDAVAVVAPLSASAAAAAAAAAIGSVVVDDSDTEVDAPAAAALPAAASVSQRSVTTGSAGAATVTSAAAAAALSAATVLPQGRVSAASIASTGAASQSGAAASVESTAALPLQVAGGPSPAFAASLASSARPVTRSVATVTAAAASTASSVAASTGSAAAGHADLTQGTASAASRSTFASVPALGPSPLSASSTGGAGSVMGSLPSALPTRSQRRGPAQLLAAGTAFASAAPGAVTVRGGGAGTLYSSPSALPQSSPFI